MKVADAILPRVDLPITASSRCREQQAAACIFTRSPMHASLPENSITPSSDMVVSDLHYPDATDSGSHVNIFLSRAICQSPEHHWKPARRNTKYNRERGLVLSVRALICHKRGRVCWLADTSLTLRDQACCVGTGSESSAIIL